MYSCNPFTYFVESFLGTAPPNTGATCAPNEYLRFNAPNGSTCIEYYMQDSMDVAGGFLRYPQATGQCELAETNKVLRGVNINFANRWRDFGIMWAFVFFNVILAVFFFWLVRVPKSKKPKSAHNRRPPKDATHPCNNHPLFSLCFI